MSTLSFINSYDDAWKTIIAPPRQEYTLDQLGPTEFGVKSNRIKRLDFKLLNRRGLVIECSFYQQVNITTPYPCVIYLHGNGCSRLEGSEYAEFILKNPVSYFCFDFTACGRSDGEYSSVGLFEQDDLDCILTFLETTGSVSKICLWGRSMGATTALFCSAKQMKAKCLILDSPFANFKNLLKEIAKKKTSIPGFLTGGAYHVIRKTILNKAKFDIDELRPIDHVDKLRVPALFGVGKDDSFVSPEHTKELYSAYLGPKKIEFFEGDHNSKRPTQWLIAVQNFIKTYLLEPEKEIFKLNMENYLPSDAPRTEQLKYSSKPPRDSQLKPMKFSWLEPVQPTLRTPRRATNERITVESPVFGGIINNDFNQDECLSSRQRQRGVSAACFRSNGTSNTGTGMVSPQDSTRFNTELSTDPSLKTDFEETQTGTFIKPQKILQSDYSKANLGPKLVNSRVEKGGSNTNRVGLDLSYQQIEKNIEEYRKPLPVYSKMSGGTGTGSIYSNMSPSNNYLEQQTLRDKGLNSIRYLSPQHSYRADNLSPSYLSPESGYRSPNTYSPQGNQYEEIQPRSYHLPERFGPVLGDKERSRASTMHHDRETKSLFVNVENPLTPKGSSRVIQIKIDPKSPIFGANQLSIRPEYSREHYPEEVSHYTSFQDYHQQSFLNTSANGHNHYDNSTPAGRYDHIQPSLSREKIEVSPSVYGNYSFDKKRVSMETFHYPESRGYTKGA